LALPLFWASQPAHAYVKMQFKYPDGSTNWQHVANWSGSILIILLTIVVINLFFIWRKLRKSNLELQEIRNDLELRVQERTATLTETNKLLENEITMHKNTASKLRSSEAYIKDILKSMPLMLIGVNRDGKITQWNKRAGEITGTTAEAILGKNLWEAYPVITVTVDQVNDVIEKNEPVSIKYSQRGQYCYDITIYPLQEQSEPGVVILIDDVTKKMLAENMLIQNDKMSSMGELASSMAHDINTPLQSILLDLRTFQNYLTDSSQRINEIDSNEVPGQFSKLLSDAYEKGEKVASIVRNLQDFARGRSDRIQLANMVDVIEHTLELAAEILSEPSGLKFKDITIEKNYEKTLPMVPCYVTELQQALLSLLRHAFDSLGRVKDSTQKPKISIQMIVSYDSFWIKIHHNGIGLSDDELMYLFEPFIRKDSPDIRYDAGKRLSFAHFVITEQHQGQIAATSDLELGTTFHIQLLLKIARAKKEN